MSIYYKDQNGQVFVYESQEEREQYGGPSLVLMSEDEVIAHLNPPLTYKDELAAVNLAYQVDVDKFNRAFAVAYLSDGPSQESKQAAIRAQYEVRKAQHANDVIDLKIKYGV